MIELQYEEPKYKDPKMQEYYNTLPSAVKSLIDTSGIEISSLGMLTKLGDYHKNNLESNEASN